MDERIPPQYGIHLMTDIVKKKSCNVPLLGRRIIFPIAYLSQSKTAGGSDSFKVRQTG